MPHVKGKPRPVRWMYKDPDLHKKHRPFLKHRSQCAFRNEEWNFSFEEWCSIWTEEKWALRGRQADQLCMRRLDSTRPWQVDNVELITRRQMVSDNRARQVQLFWEKRRGLSNNAV